MENTIDLPLEFGWVLPELFAEIERHVDIAEDGGVAVTEMNTAMVRPVILYNPWRRAALVAFGIAHEFCHFVGGDHLSVVELSNKREHLADIFAAEMLFDLLEQKESSTKKIKELAMVIESQNDMVEAVGVVQNFENFSRHLAASLIGELAKPMDSVQRLVAQMVRGSDTITPQALQVYGQAVHDECKFITHIIQSTTHNLGQSYRNGVKAIDLNRLVSQRHSKCLPMARKHGIDFQHYDGPEGLRVVANWQAADDILFAIIRFCGALVGGRPGKKVVAIKPSNGEKGGQVMVVASGANIDSPETLFEPFGEGKSKESLTLFAARRMARQCGLDIFLDKNIKDVGCRFIFSFN